MGAQRRLHQRAHIARQHFLAIGHPELGSAAQARDRAAARNDDLIGHVHAKRAEHLAALFLQLNELGGANAVNIRYHEIVECHARGTVFLAQVHIAKRRGKHGAQLVMGLQVHAEALPHFTIVCHVRFPLRAKAASHPWGRAHMRPSRSVSNNYHATNRQPTRNMGAKKETSGDGAEWRTRCRCASVASPSRHMGHALRVQNDGEAEFVVERSVAAYSASVARGGRKRKL